MERKSKLKKKVKFLYFRPHKRLFESAESELNGGERSVFWRNQRSKQLIEVLKCVYDVTNSETLSGHIFWLKHIIQKVKYTLYC